MAPLGNELIQQLLRDTARSFYLTLRVLPSSIRPQIGLAYLLARTTDTIADTDLVPVEKRLDALRVLRERILGTARAALAFGDLASQQAAPVEKLLLEKTEVSLDFLRTFSVGDQDLIRAVIDTITSGQELDLRRFAAASERRVVALANAGDLDDYTYRVAGCVGEFWTKICRAHCFPAAPLDMDLLLARGIRFGKGLQLVNILRDLPRDLRQGRCYLPEDELRKLGLHPADLLAPESEPRLRPVYDSWLETAEQHLTAGWEYTNSLPWRCMRIRLACAWPIQIGLRTIQMLRRANVLDPAQRVKVSRGELKGMMARSILWYPWPGRWRALGQSGQP